VEKERHITNMNSARAILFFKNISCNRLALLHMISFHFFIAENLALNQIIFQMSFKKVRRKLSKVFGQSSTNLDKIAEEPNGGGVANWAKGDQNHLENGLASTIK